MYSVTPTLFRARSNLLTPTRFSLSCSMVYRYSLFEHRCKSSFRHAIATLVSDMETKQWRLTGNDSRAAGRPRSAERATGRKPGLTEPKPPLPQYLFITSRQARIRDGHATGRTSQSQVGAYRLEAVHGASPRYQKWRIENGATFRSSGLDSKCPSSKYYGGRVCELYEKRSEEGVRSCRQSACLRDLRFHDLRHEATTRFFEMGLNVMEVAAITGHKDIRMLSRYTHLRAEDIALKLAWPIIAPF